MIIDNIENISKYACLIPEDVIEFIKNCRNIEFQNAKRVSLNGNNYANFDIYNPKPLDLCKFEAHKKYIDIQIMLDGEEQIDITNIEGLDVLEEYNEEKDIIFYKAPDRLVDKISLTKGKFVLIYPYEAHKPQIKTISNSVKKIVVKVLA